MKRVANLIQMINVYYVENKHNKICFVWEIIKLDLIEYF
jgi:hypothetical protein